MATGALPIGQSGPPMLRVVTPQALTTHTREKERSAVAPAEDVTMDALARHVRPAWDIVRNHPNSAAGWNGRVLPAQRVFNGLYDASKLAEIRKRVGPDVYARISALKCRGA